MSEDQLADIVKMTGLRPIELVRRKEPQFKALGLSEDTPDAEVLRALAEHPNLLQRPIVESGGKAVIARPAERALELFG